MDALYPRDWKDVLEILAATGSFLFVSILLLIRQPLSPNRSMCTMVSRKLYNMSQGQTVTAQLARDPSQCPQKVFHRLFEGHHSVHAHSDSESDSDSISKWEQLDELQKARSCGNFGTTETSELFLKVGKILSKVADQYINLITILRSIMMLCAPWRKTLCPAWSLRLCWAALECCP